MHLSTNDMIALARYKAACDYLREAGIDPSEIVVSPLLSVEEWAKLDFRYLMGGGREWVSRMIREAVGD